MVLSLAVIASLAASPVTIAKSPDHRVALVELFTSEGCSSCPPADAALAALGGDFGRVVPLAFHVTYWDYIGWQDRFADARFDRRQRDYASRHDAARVYTPQVIVNGRDLGAWRRDLKTTLAAVATEPVGFDVRVEAEWAAWDDAKQQVTLRAFAAARPGHEGKATLHLAVFERRLETVVKAGENGGRTLRHDWVVREIAAVGAIRDGRGEIRHTQTIAADWKRSEVGVAAWVSDPGWQVVQATGGMLPPSRP